MKQRQIYHILFIMCFIGVLALTGCNDNSGSSLTSPDSKVGGKRWYIVSGFTSGAWVGHFVLEKNRPATFRYPIWSFLCDFRMWGHMARGRLWSGDPLEALGLQVPADVAEAA